MNIRVEAEMKIILHIEDFDIDQLIMFSRTNTDGQSVHVLVCRRRYVVDLVMRGLDYHKAPQ